MTAQLQEKVGQTVSFFPVGFEHPAYDRHGWQNPDKASDQKICQMHPCRSIRELCARNCRCDQRIQNDQCKQQYCADQLSHSLPHRITVLVIVPGSNPYRQAQSMDKPNDAALCHATMRLATLSRLRHINYQTALMEESA